MPRIRVLEIIRQFRRDAHAELGHVDFLYTVEAALPLIASTRVGQD